jgi:hypothetical protein
MGREKEERREERAKKKQKTRPDEGHCRKVP